MPWFALAAVGSYYYFKVPAREVPNGETSRARTRAGSARCVNEKFKLVDDSRHTQSYDRHSGHPHRELKGEIWRPAVLKKAAPLVVYSHGFMSYRREGLYLSRFLASHGYTVVAVDYPLTGAKAPGKPLAKDIVNQPGDISCVIDYMLARNGNPADRLYDTIDPDKIAVAGLSYGALTSLLSAYHRELYDPRIRAAISIAGPTSMLSPVFFAGSSTPALMIYGDADSLVHYDDHALPAFDRISDATLVTLKNGSHTGFSQPGSTMLRFLKNPDSLACSMLRWNMDNKPWDFVTDLGGADMGIVEPHEEIAPLTTPMVPTAMKASRQQLFTSLAAHAFLDSRFSSKQSTRRQALRFLQKTLSAENGAEVSVKC